MGNSHGKPVVFTDQVNLSHFRLLRVVGKGAFGKVRIVERKDTGCTFALKYIRKDEVVRSESVRNIIRERRMLEHLNHPFLCNLRFSFQDIEYIYLVVDLMTGGDLRFHISRKSFTEDAVRFWIAQLGCALRYIHSQRIVHRDLKPDNVLLDAQGHVHLADFNVASDFKPDKPLTSKSGTLAYLAPEVYEGRGYSSEVDWWSLGVTFYECIYNKRPFEAHNHDSLSAKIRKAEPPYPQTNPPLSDACIVSIQNLLTKDRSRRIGAVSFESFTNSPFFRVIDFEDLENKRLEPVFQPATDKTNFDATYDLEELLLEEAPLEARARRQKPRSQLKVDATKEEIRAEELHRMIEKLFEPFDYTQASFEKADDFTETDGVPPNLIRSPTATSTSLGMLPDPSEFDAHGGSSSLFSKDTPPHSSVSPLGEKFSRSRPQSSKSRKGGVIGLRIRGKTASNESARSVRSSKSVASTQAEERAYLQQQQYLQQQYPPNQNHQNYQNQNYTVLPAAVPESMQGHFIPTTSIQQDGREQLQRQENGKSAEGSSSGGVLAFLSRKRATNKSTGQGRNRSRSSKERGVLGKEGARVIVG